jgi:hypothetical protein
MTRPNRYLFEEANAAFRERHGQCIVEIGAIRHPDWGETDGHSTLRWPEGATVWSIDHDPLAVTLTRSLAATRPNVLCVLADGLSFLRAFPIPMPPGRG